jgi:hypothetical protein
MSRQVVWTNCLAKLSRLIVQRWRPPASACHNLPTDFHGLRDRGSRPDSSGSWRQSRGAEQYPARLARFVGPKSLRPILGANGVGPVAGASSGRDGVGVAAATVRPGRTGGPPKTVASISDRRHGGGDTAATEAGRAERRSARGQHRWPPHAAALPREGFVSRPSWP